MCCSSAAGGVICRASESVEWRSGLRDLLRIVRSSGCKDYQLGEGDRLVCRASENLRNTNDARV
jgi:hypothetical protein